ncbi:MAG: GTP-binding protein [Candidatus Thorarchaeota archaeon]|nr:GTP-binding protein [Candidatus Thorarchaeota archaeon]
MSFSPTRDRQFKTVLIGDTGVGKTSIRRSYMGKSFSSSHIATLGVDFAQKNVKHKEANVRLAIWDLAGQHSFESVRKHYYQGCHSIIFVYSVIDSTSFINSSRWFVEVSKYLKPLPCVAVLGNKIDLRSTSTATDVVSAKEGEEFSKRFDNKLGIPVVFRETSALTGENIQEIFDEIVGMMLDENPLKYQQSNNLRRMHKL